MKKSFKKWLCGLLAALLLTAGTLPVAAAEYTIASTVLTVGENRVSTLADVATTLYVFKPAVGAYRIEATEDAAILSYWHGTKFYVTGLAETAVDGVLTVECSAAGQALLIGLAGVESATISITEIEGYVPPVTVVFEPYINVHTPVEDFALPDEELTPVEIMKPQTLVADADGIYHLDTVDGPILYVNMCAAVYADLYACYHPSGGSGALTMHGRYEDEEGNIRGYEFIDAMRPYAEALDANGYYYLTVDLAAYLQTYGANQGWFRQDSSPFLPIKRGRFIEQSAWLVNACYVEPVVEQGDVDGNGEVNNRDMGLLQRYINGWDIVIDIAAGDMDGDGELNNRDMGLLQRRING